MIASLILAAVATATPTPSPTVSPTTTPSPQAGVPSETYGGKIPLQLRPHTAGDLSAEPTPTVPPNSLAGVAARIKLHREGLQGGRITQANIPSRDPALGAPAAEPSTPPTTFDMITAKERCANLYPESFEDQIDCVKALQAIAIRTPRGVPPEEFGKLRAYCADRWPTKPNMQDYCEKNELEAWYRLHPETR
ncbi:MAG: hypothetical protein EPN53_00980 [Acidobacteria bacterium]|nr:MAG: hypothetical protein EPN53_00980 [Acidobacteriota bacterium]